MNIDFNDIIKFEPEKVKKAISELDRRIGEIDRERSIVVEKVNLLRRLLKMNESSNDNQPAKVNPDATHQKKPLRFQEMTIKDAAVLVLEEQGGKAHGKVILDALIAGGVRFSGSTPMSSLTATLIRSADNFERAPGERNTWRLKN